MKKDKNKKVNYEVIVRNILIVLTLISLFISLVNYTRLIYNDSVSMDYAKLESIESFCSSINGVVLWVDNILLFGFSIAYIVLGVKSKKEVLLKISFSIFSVLTTIVVSILVINLIGEIFGIF